VERAAEVGLTQRDVATNLLVAIAGTGQTNPNYWTDPKTGNAYAVTVQVPEYRLGSTDDLLGLTIMTAAGPQQLRDLATLSRQSTQVFTSRVNVQPTYNVRADTSRSDLGSVKNELDKIVVEAGKLLPPGASITVRGQVDSMSSAFDRLFLGVLIAALLVYCLMVVNFQSWLDPLIILGALPGAGIGIMWALLLTGTTFNVPSVMGAIMSIGVGTANSILVVSFARDRQAEGVPAFQAALDAGRTRLRPVLMTALAMIIGMLPMALDLHEGGEQNAAIGRAVIGGLVGATLATLFLVPVLYSLAHEKLRARPAQPREDEELLA
jgi:multidrug efflux pump subunit AcrB